MNGIAKFTRRQSYEHMMFGYVHGVKENLPTVSVEKAIAQFFEVFNINHDDYKIESAHKAYQRMSTEYYEMLKNESKRKG